MKELILPLEKQVCSLESAKRLKELGFPQESLFYWSDWCRHDSKEVSKVIQFRDRVPLLYKASYSYFWEEDLYSAYTVAELGELLPKEIINKDGMSQWLKIIPIGKDWMVVYDHVDEWLTPNFIWCGQTKSNMVESLAKMLIYLAEEGLYERT